MAKGRKPEPIDDDPGDEALEAGCCGECEYYDEEEEGAGCGACLHPDLEEYDLQITEDSRCNLFSEQQDEDDEDEELFDEDEEEEDEESEF